MKKYKINSKKTAVALLLLFSFSTLTAVLPQVLAHDPAWQNTSYAFLSVAPDTVGVGQTVSIVMWVDWPLPASLVGNDIRRHNYTLTITKPDGETDVMHWDVVTDTTNFQFAQYTPTQMGTYTLTFDYPAQVYTWEGEYQNDVFSAASRTKTLTVTEEQITFFTDSYPLPTEYWTRPIEGQNTYWASISSNFLGKPYITGAASPVGIPGFFQPDGLAPNSPHVMWTKPIEYGGLVGGTNTAVYGEMYYQGGSYNPRFQNPIIMQGTLFYEEPLGNSGTGGDYVAVDLTTGEELWRIDPAASGTRLVPSFGYLYSYESPNQHGVLPNGLLIAPTTQNGVSIWRAYNSMNGELLALNVTNVPSVGSTESGAVVHGSAQIPGPSGEYLSVLLVNDGDETDPQWRIKQWNSANVIGAGANLRPDNWYTGTVDASVESAYDWDVAIDLPSGSWGIGSGGLRGAIPLVSKDNIMLLVQGTFGGHINSFLSRVTFDPAKITAVSLKPEDRGEILWTKSYPPAENNVTRTIANWDPERGVFFFEDVETMTKYGYSLEDGNLLWGPTQMPNDAAADWNYLSLDNDLVAYGNIYYTGYSGILYCYDVETGDLKWTYGNGDEGNSTYSGLNTIYGNYPTFVVGAADGKIYMCTTEHSPNSPLSKGSKYRCINATDGTEIWTLMGTGNAMYGAFAALADGYLVVLNTYDSQIYCIGKGPSKITVDAPLTGISLGDSVVLRGTITDIASGTNQNEQAARFPNGVPAMSDESMTAWMQSVYMQKPRPEDATGVNIKLEAIDPNNNYQYLGTATSDSYGNYGFTWKPEISGTYMIMATFEDTESYWGSTTTTYLAVDPAASASTPIDIDEPTDNEPIDTEEPTGFVINTEIAIIAAVSVAAVLGVVAYILLKRK